MTRRLLFAILTTVIATTLTYAQPKKPEEETKAVPGKLTAVTVYQNTALITREIPLPEATGLHEIVVSPLPPTVIENSLYAESNENIRILSTRFRTRQLQRDNREEVNKSEVEIKELLNKISAMEADLKANVENEKFLTKLENFTAATMTTLTDKGVLDSEKTIKLASFIREARTAHAKEDTTLKQSMQVLQEKLAYLKRTLGDIAGRPVRTERDGVITLEKTKEGKGIVKLNYFVNSASWSPQYKLRSSKNAAPVNVEYLAIVGQRTGENWDNVNLTLSTAQPLLSATPPDLRALEVSVIAGLAVDIPATNLPVQPNASIPQQMAGSGGPPGAGGGGRKGYLDNLTTQSQQLKKQAQDNFNKRNDDIAQQLSNSGAALGQFRELLLTKEEVDKEKANPFGEMTKGVSGDEIPSVTYNLKNKLSVPSRQDDQTVEISRFELAAKHYFKAVPVLTQYVYRVADLSNTTDLVFLPGEATMYQGTDFVGRATIPLIAIGKSFTVGFGVDPQLQVTRKLMDKNRVTQGGNQQLKFNYRILLSSYKSEAVDVQVWDRLPMSEAAQVITVSLTPPKKELSTDPIYVRDEKPKNLLRWDVKVDPKQNGEKALEIDYEFKLELDKNVNIVGAISK